MRYYNLVTGQEVTMRRSTQGTFWSHRGVRNYVGDSDRFGKDAPRFRIDQPRRKRTEDGCLYPDALFFTKEWKSWTLRWLDENGDQIGPAVYAMTKAELYRVIREETHVYAPQPTT